MGSGYSQLVFQPAEQATYGEDLENLLWIDADTPTYEDDPSKTNSNPASNQSSQRNSTEDASAQTTTSPVNAGKMPLVYYEWVGREGEKAAFTLIYCQSTTPSTDLGQLAPWLKLIRDVLNVCWDSNSSLTPSRST